MFWLGEVTTEARFIFPWSQDFILSQNTALPVKRWISCLHEPATILLYDIFTAGNGTLAVPPESFKALNILPQTQLLQIPFHAFCTDETEVCIPDFKSRTRAFFSFWLEDRMATFYNNWDFHRNTVIYIWRSLIGVRLLLGVRALHVSKSWWRWQV